ncbi:MAG: hypothetical protein NTW58_06450 [Actinobacteria bacterium]|nr:hypothetical protein [Actinomycetota bacterium]
MTQRLTFLVLCLALISVLAVAALWRPSRDAGGALAATAPSATAGAGGSPAAAELPSTSEGAQRLEAVRTVKLFCDLVGSRRFWNAAALFATPRVWTRGQLRAVRRLDFRTARIDFAPDANTLVVIARVHASGSFESPVRSDHTTLFFTLGRVGDTAGGWLITAVTASP